MKPCNLDRFLTKSEYKQNYLDCVFISYPEIINWLNSLLIKWCQRMNHKCVWRILFNFICWFYVFFYIKQFHIWNSFFFEHFLRLYDSIIKFSINFILISIWFDPHTFLHDWMGNMNVSMMMKHRNLFGSSTKTPMLL